MINWFEIPVTNIGRAQQFYETIFNIKMTPLDLGENFKMVLFPTLEGSIKGGALCQHAEAYKPSEYGALIYLNANPSIADIIERVTTAGGQVILNRRQISEERGFMALFKDTEGNRIALQADN